MLRSSVFWARAALTLARQSRHFVPQNTITDCGVASALTVLNMAGRAVNPVEVSERLDPNKAGTTLNDLRQLFDEDQDFKARALGVRAESMRQIQGHVILHMSRAHYVVLLQASRVGVLCFDPSLGPVFYPQAEFEKLYSGFLLEVLPQGKVRPLPAPHERRQGGVAQAALFLLGGTMRALEAALVLSLCFGLFLVANRASLSSLLSIIGVVTVCGVLLIAVRRMRVRGQEVWVRRRQGLLWRGLLRTITRGNDLHGFRNQRERDVAGRLRRGLVVELPKRAQFPAILGSTIMMAGVLAFLSPILSLFYLAVAATITGVTLLDDVKICRRSVRKNEGKYTQLSRGRLMLNSKTAPMLLGEISKWTLIGIAGYGVLASGLPTPVMMFWVLMAMQIVPTDLRTMPALAQAFAPKVPISPLLGSESMLRVQKMVGDVPLKLKRRDGLILIEGITPLTEPLQHSNLTIRELRLVLADIVKKAVVALPENERSQIGAVRLFGPGQYVTESDFENIALDEEVRQGTRLPVKRSSKVQDDGRGDPLRRAMRSCGPDDFPVFWDLRNKMKLDELRSGLRAGPVKRAGHLSMSRLTVIEEA